MHLGARIASLIPGSLLDRETLSMLEAGTTADPTITTRLLRRPPRAVESFISPEARTPLRRDGQLQWLLPILRASVAAVWLWSGILALGLYPQAQSYALLARAGLTGTLAALALYGSAALDLVFGVASLVMRRRRVLWLAQIALILVYTMIISARLPEYWLHPYGPILKNLPMLAALSLLYVMEESR
jgi:hypothetical protein